MGCMVLRGILLAARSYVEARFTPSVLGVRVFTCFFCVCIFAIHAKVSPFISNLVHVPFWSSSVSLFFNRKFVMHFDGHKNACLLALFWVAVTMNGTASTTHVFGHFMNAHKNT